MRIPIGDPSGSVRRQLRSRPSRVRWFGLRLRAGAMIRLSNRSDPVRDLLFVALEPARVRI
jgi:hypothetical protein